MYASLYKNVLRFVLKESNEGESRISHGTKFHRVGPAFKKTFYVCLEHEEALVRPISKSSYYFVYKSTWSTSWRLKLIGARKVIIFWFNLFATKCKTIYYNNQHMWCRGHHVIALPFKLGDPGSILSRTSTQGLKIIEEKKLPLHWHQ
jgi:hypothetical protein